MENAPPHCTFSCSSSISYLIWHSILFGLCISVGLQVPHGAALHVVGDLHGQQLGRKQRYGFTGFPRASSQSAIMESGLKNRVWYAVWDLLPELRSDLWVSQRFIVAGLQDLATTYGWAYSNPTNGWA